jgi:hypothetical protein
MNLKLSESLECRIKFHNLFERKLSEVSKELSFQFQQKSKESNVNLDFK